MDTQEIFSKIGLTSLETKTYLALLKLQESQTGALCKETNIPSSKIYKILDSLIKKGLVNYRVQNNIKIFMPAPVETLNELFLEKQKKLEEERKQVAVLVKNLKTQELEKEPYSNYKYYEGIIGIKSMWHEINSHLQHLNKKETIKVYAGKREAYELMAGFYDIYHKERTKQKIKQQLILPFEGTDYAKKRKKQGVESKFMNLKNYTEWGVLGDIFFIQITSKVFRGFLIKDKLIAETFSQVFDEVWKVARK